MFVRLYEDGQGPRGKGLSGVPDISWLRPTNEGIVAAGGDISLLLRTFDGFATTEDRLLTGAQWEGEFDESRLPYLVRAKHGAALRGSDDVRGTAVLDFDLFASDDPRAENASYSPGYYLTVMLAGSTSDERLRPGIIGGRFLFQQFTIVNGIDLHVVVAEFVTFGACVFFKPSDIAVPVPYFQVGPDMASVSHHRLTSAQLETAISHAAKGAAVHPPMAAAKVA